jgi:hypothetical protein
MPLRAQPDGPQYPDLYEMRALAFVYLRAALYVVNDRGCSQFSLVAHIKGAPNAEYFAHLRARSQRCFRVQIITSGAVPAS